MNVGWSVARRESPFPMEYDTYFLLVRALLVRGIWRIHSSMTTVVVVVVVVVVAVAAAAAAAAAAVVAAAVLAQ